MPHIFLSLLLIYCSSLFNYWSFSSSTVLMFYLWLIHVCIQATSHSHRKSLNVILYPSIQTTGLKFLCKTLSQKPKIRNKQTNKKSCYLDIKTLDKWAIIMCKMVTTSSPYKVGSETQSSFWGVFITLMVIVYFTFLCNFLTIYMTWK